MNKNKLIYILGIESSCDDTSASVICNGKILSNVIANQEIHAKYGGVVPELASRAHQQNIVPVVQQAIRQKRLKCHSFYTRTWINGFIISWRLVCQVTFTSFKHSINCSKPHARAHFSSFY